MARIAGLEYAEATDLMTAALRGFNMELNETSAKRVNDVYSELAAITASDTEELGTAMQRTASIAASAPLPMAAPTSAPASTGASLMPSPTKTSLPFSDLSANSFSTCSTLSAGNNSARYSVMPRLSAT